MSAGLSKRGHFRRIQAYIYLVRLHIVSSRYFFWGERTVGRGKKYNLINCQLIPWHRRSPDGGCWARFAGHVGRCGVAGLKVRPREAMSSDDIAALSKRLEASEERQRQIRSEIAREMQVHETLMASVSPPSPQPDASSNAMFSEDAKVAPADSAVSTALLVSSPSPGASVQSTRLRLENAKLRAQSEFMTEQAHARAGQIEALEREAAQQDSVEAGLREQLAELQRTRLEDTRKHMVAVGLLESQLETCKSQAAEQVQATRQLQARLETMEKEREAEQRGLVQVERQKHQDLARLCREQESAVARLEQLAAGIQSRDQRIAELDQELSSSRFEIGVLQKQAAKLDSTIRESRADLSSARDRCSALEVANKQIPALKRAAEEAERLRVEVRNSQHALSRTTDNIERIGVQHQELQAAHAKAVESGTAAEARARDAEERIVELEDRARSAERQASLLAVKLRAAEQKTKQLESRVKQQAGVLDAGKAALATVKTSATKGCSRIAGALKRALESPQDGVKALGPGPPAPRGAADASVRDAIDDIRSAGLALVRAFKESRGLCAIHEQRAAMLSKEVARERKIYNASAAQMSRTRKVLAEMKKVFEAQKSQLESKCRRSAQRCKTLQSKHREAVAALKTAAASKLKAVESEGHLRVAELRAEAKHARKRASAEARGLRREVEQLGQNVACARRDLDAVRAEADAALKRRSQVEACCWVLFRALAPLETRVCELAAQKQFLLARVRGQEAISARIVRIADAVRSAGGGVSAAQGSARPVGPLGRLRAVVWTIVAAARWRRMGAERGFYGRGRGRAATGARMIDCGAAAASLPDFPPSSPSLLLGSVLGFYARGRKGGPGAALEPGVFAALERGAQGGGGGLVAAANAGLARVERTVGEARSKLSRAESLLENQRAAAEAARAKLQSTEATLVALRDERGAVTQSVTALREQVAALKDEAKRFVPLEDHEYVLEEFGQLKEYAVRLRSALGAAQNQAEFSRLRAEKLAAGLDAARGKEQLLEQSLAERSRELETRGKAITELRVQSAELGKRLDAAGRELVTSREQGARAATDKSAELEAKLRASNDALAQKSGVEFKLRERVKALEAENNALDRRVAEAEGIKSNMLLTYRRALAACKDLKQEVTVKSRDLARCQRMLSALLNSPAKGAAVEGASPARGQRSPNRGASPTDVRVSGALLAESMNASLASGSADA